MEKRLKYPDFVNSILQFAEKSGKKCKKVEKNLHIWKNCCNFAPDFRKGMKLN